MRFREKLLIFFVAIILSVLGFNLISSSFVDLLMLAKEADNETVESCLAEGDGDASRIRNTVDNCSQTTSLISFYGNSGFCAPEASK